MFFRCIGWARATLRARGGVPWKRSPAIAPPAGFGSKQLHLPVVPDHPRELEAEQLEDRLGDRADLLVDVVLDVGGVGGGDARANLPNRYKVFSQRLSKGSCCFIIIGVPRRASFPPSGRSYRLAIGLVHLAPYHQTC